MPGPQRGRNNGITGLIDLPGVSAKFNCKVFGYQHGLNVGEKPRLGRGSDNWQAVRPISSGGNLAISAKVRIDGYPLPAIWKGQAGTIVVQHDTDVTESIPVVVTAVNFSFDERSLDTHDLTLTARVSGNPTFVGFGGTQPTADEPNPDDQEQYIGTSKTLDPKGLISGATRRTDVWGDLTDTDAAEQQRLADIIAAASVPFAGMKLRSATFQRDSLDGGEVLETWGLTDTAEDVVNPRTVETLDPERITSIATVAAINDSPTPPDGDAEFVQTSESTQELNDGNELHTATYELLDSSEKIEFPNTVTNNDPYDLEDQATVLIVHDSSTAPSDPVTAPVGELVERATTQINRVRWQTVWTYRNLNSEQKIQFPNDLIATDPSALQDEDRQADVTDSSTVPSTPTVRFTDAKLRKVISRRVGGTPEKWLHVWEFGRRTTEEDIEMPATVTDDDGSNLQDKATITQVTASATPVSPVPTAPVGQHVRTETEQLHNSNGGKWRHTFVYANNTTEQDVEFGATLADDDPSNLEDVETIREVTGSITFPTHSPTITGLVVRKQVSQRIGGTPEKWQHTTHYGRRTTEQDHTFSGTVTDDDASDLIDEKTITIIDDSTPTPPNTPDGYKLVNTHFEQLTDAGKWKYRYDYKRRTNQEAIEFDNSDLADDPSNIADTQTIVQIDSVSVATATPPGTPSGLKLREQSSRQIHDASTGAKWRNTYVFARRNREDDVEMDGTVYDIDESSLQSKVSITVVEADSSPDGGVSVSGLVLRNVTKKQIHGATGAEKWEITYHFGERTTEEDVEFDGTVTINDADDLRDEATITTVNDSSTYPSAFDTPPTGLKLRFVKSRQQTNSGKWVHTAEYGRRDTEDDAEMSETVYNLDESSLKSTASVGVVESDGTPDGGVSVSGLVLRNVEKKQLHDSKWLITYQFGERTTEEDVEFAGTITQDDPDNLLDHATVTLVNDSATYPIALDTPPSGLKLREIRSEQLTNSGKYVHTGTYGRRDTEDDVEMDGSAVTDDESDLADSQITVVVTASGTPSNPGTPTGLKLRETFTKQLHDSKWRHEFRYARTNREDDVEFGDTVTILDAEALESGGAIAIVNTSATPPADPGAPATDTKLVSTTTKQIHGAATPKYVHIFKYGPRTTQEDIEWLQARAIAEAGHLDRRPVTVEVTTSSTPGSGTNPDATNLSLYSTTSHRVTDTQYVHVFQWSPLTATESMDADNTLVTVDPGTIPLGTKQTECVIDGNSTAPTAPTVSGLVCFQQETKRVGRVKYRHVYHYKYRSNEDDLIADKTRTTTDAGALKHEAVTADVWLVSGGDPGDGTAPMSPTGLKLVDKTDLEVPNPLYRVRVYRWGLTNSEDDIEYGGTVTEYDPANLYRNTLLTVENHSGTAEALAITQAEALRGTAEFDGLSVRKITPDKAALVVRERTDDKLWRQLMRTDRDVTRSLASGQIHVTQAVTVATGLYWMSFSPITQQRTRGTGILHRRVVADSLADVAFTSLRGLRNSGAFMGKNTGYWRYVGHDIKVSMALSGENRLFDIDYLFEFDSLLHFSDANIPSPGGYHVTVAPSVGYQMANDFDGSWDVTFPSTADFSVFLGTIP